MAHAGEQVQIPPQSHHDEAYHRRLLALAIRRLFDGKHSAHGEFTVTDSTTTTVVTDRRVGVHSVITFMPTTANAAGELATLYVSSRGDGTFTVTHANAASVDRTFAYSIAG